MGRDLRWGLKWGILAGAFFGCVTAVILLLKQDSPRGVHPALIVLSYPLAGVLGGVMVGLLRPFLVSRRNSSLTGALVGVLVAGCLMQMVFGPPSHWTGQQFTSVLITGGILGSLAGYQWWDLREG